MSDTEEKGTAVAEEEEKAEESAADAVQTAIAGEEATVEEEDKGGEEEKKGEEEEKEEEKAKVELPELSDEQRAALAEDPAMQKLLREKGSDDLNAFINETLKEHDKTKETEKEQAAERKTLEEAEKAYREDNDPAPLAQIAADNLAKARQRAEMSAEVEVAAYEQVRPFVEAEYGEIVRALKPEEVKALDEMPLVDALKDLAGRKATAIRGESASDKEAAGKAIQNASTAGAARDEAGNVLPGGTAVEAVGDDIGTLMRQGMEDALDVEEAQGG